MNTLLIVENSLISQGLPQVAISTGCHVIDILNLDYLDAFRFDYPRNLPISKVPHLHPVCWSLDDSSEADINGSVAIVQTYGRDAVKTFKSVREQVRSLSRQVNNYDEVVICVSYNYRAYFEASLLLSSLVAWPERTLSSSSQMFVDKLDNDSLINAWHLREPHSPKNHPLTQYAEAKYLFDWLWAINSAPVFGKALRVSGACDKNILGKYELLTFLLLAKGEFLVSNQSKHPSSRQVLDKMSTFKGTGKYSVESISLGNSSSRDMILKSMVQRGLVDEGFVLTTAGRRFYKFIHPRSYDPDLPFRIDQWCKEGDIKKIKNYIITYFKRQRNLNSNPSLCS